MQLRRSNFVFTTCNQRCCTASLHTLPPSAFQLFSISMAFYICVTTTFYLFCEKLFSCSIFYFSVCFPRLCGGRFSEFSRPVTVCYKENYATREFVLLGFRTFFLEVFHCRCCIKDVVRRCKS